MTIEEARALRAEIPDDVYATFGGMSGASQSWLLLMILHELRELRKENPR